MSLDSPRLTRSGSGKVSSPGVEHHTGSAELDRLAAEHDRIWKGFLAARPYVLQQAENTKTPEELEAEAESFCWEIFSYHEHMPPERLSIAHIQKMVAEHFNVSVADILSVRRTVCIAMPRHIAIYLCRELTQRTLPEIARLFGHRDHTTILHSVQKISDILEGTQKSKYYHHLKPEDSVIAADIAALRARLGQ
jgi:Bacterial dnaA protein helix-turn-helix